MDWMALINPLLEIVKPFGGMILSLGAVAVGLFMTFVFGKNAGKKEQRAKQIEESYNAERTRGSIEDRYRTASDDERERMRNPFRRD